MVLCGVIIYFFLQKTAQVPCAKTTATGQILLISRSMYSFKKSKRGGNLTVATEAAHQYVRFVMT